MQTVQGLATRQVRSHFPFPGLVAVEEVLLEVVLEDVPLVDVLDLLVDVVGVVVLVMLVDMLVLLVDEVLVNEMLVDDNVVLPVDVNVLNH